MSGRETAAPIAKLLIANRGEIALRIMRTCRLMGIATVAVYADPDRDHPFVREADEAVPLGGASPATSYLRGDAIVAAALSSGADAVHPGYGFLAEDAAFARRCAEAGLTFVGPPADVIAAMGSKLEAKGIAAAAGVPVLSSLNVDGSPPSAEALSELGFPLLVKASAGGGGRGMRRVERAADLADAIAAAQREAEGAFGDATVFLEPYVSAPRHVEIQIFGDTHGTVIDLYERECSIQRRHQKILEESPSPAIDSELRERMAAAAIAMGRAIGYVGAGTVEFILGDGGRFWLLEVNTRLQVEHPVTEAITGLDLVRLQLEVAQGGRVPERPPAVGHAIEVRLCAEDPERDWMPMTGTVHRFRYEPSPGFRVDSGIADGVDVSPHYDSMVAKAIVHAPSRAEAARRLAAELGRMHIHGPRTNRDLLVRLLGHPEFLAGTIDTHFLERNPPSELGRPLADGTAERLHAVAAALGAMAWRRGSAPLLRSIPAGWRNVTSQPQRVSFAGENGELAAQYLITRDGIRVTVEGLDGDLHVVAASPDGVDVILNGVRRHLAVHRVGDVSYVDSVLGSSALRHLPRFPDLAAAEAPGSLHASMPGIVVRVLVEPGQRVEKGADLVVIEAMKMEHWIHSPHAGTVAALPVEPGQSIAAGALLAVVEQE